MKGRICAFKQCLLAMKRLDGSIIWLCRGAAECVSCVGHGVCYLCGCVSQDDQDGCLFGRRFLRQPSVRPSRDARRLPGQTSPLCLGVGPRAHACVTASCSHPQMLHLHRFLGQEEVSRASLMKAKQEGGSVRLLAKEPFSPKRRCAAAPPPPPPPHR